MRSPVPGDSHSHRPFETLPDPFQSRLGASTLDDHPIFIEHAKMARPIPRSITTVHVGQKAGRTFTTLRDVIFAVPSLLVAVLSLPLVPVLRFLTAGLSSGPRARNVLAANFPTAPGRPAFSSISLRSPLRLIWLGGHKGVAGRSRRSYRRVNGSDSNKFVRVLSDPATRSPCGGAVATRAEVEVEVVGGTYGQFEVEVDGNTVLKGGALAALGVLPSAQKVLRGGSGAAG